VDVGVGAAAFEAQVPRIGTILGTTPVVAEVAAEEQRTISVAAIAGRREC